MGPIVPAYAADIWDHVDPSRVCPIADLMAVGINQRAGPTIVWETVAIHGEGEKAVWRGMHTAQAQPEQARRDSGLAHYDMMDARVDTLAPVQSESRWGGRVISFTFDDQTAVKAAAGATAEERVPLQGRRPVPEGPGSPILVQAVRWAPGLDTRAFIVDRWRGTGAERLRELRVRVVGESILEVAGRPYPVYEVHWNAVDQAFRLESLVTKARPHRQLEVRYFASPTAQSPYLSRMLQVSSADSCGDES